MSTASPCGVKYILPVSPFSITAIYSRTTPSTEVKKRIMSGLANADTLGALLVVAEYLDDPELKNEAQVPR